MHNEKLVTDRQTYPHTNNNRIAVDEWLTLSTIHFILYEFILII